MSDWTAGYVADIGYTFGYYQELNPLHIKLVFLNNGLVCPEVGTACELGFGQGMSINMHAAASITQWYGTDFNPSQASFAQELAQESGAHAKLYDEAFADFANRSDLPEFDYIGLHGIWSWISDENRAVIVDFIKRKLKVGGVLYISYNTQPGWAAMVPMRDLLTEYADVMGRKGTGITTRIDEALTFADKLIATNPTYIRANPQVAGRIGKIKEQNRNYLAHEYFNKDWLPMPFSKMAEWLAPTKLQFACSANYLDHIEAINLTAEQQVLLNEIPDAMFRQTVRDFMINQQFRKDYWVKGGRKLTSVQQFQQIRALRLLMVTPRDDIKLKVAGSLGEADMSEAVYAPILDAMADYKIKTIAQLEQSVKTASITFSQLLQAIILLTGNGTFVLTNDEGVITKSKKHCDKFNAHIMELSKGSNEYRYLASPVAAGGVQINRFQQLFLQAYLQGKKAPTDWANYVWKIVAAQNQRLVHEGKTLESEEENMAELNKRAQDFYDKHLSIVKALQIV
jgi:SAM-dependent methyltransferase